MKRNFHRIISGLLTLVMLFALIGCSSSNGSSASSDSNTGAAADKQDEAQSSTPAGTKYELDIGASTTGGAMYRWVIAACDIVNKYSDIVVAQPISTLGSSENINFIDSGDCQIASVGSVPGYCAWTGAEVADWAGNPVTSLRTVYAMYPDYFGITVSGESGIKTLADLSGKRVSFDQRGNGGSTASLMIMDALGIDIEKEYDAHFTSIAETMAAIQEGSLDAHCSFGGIPTTGVQELANSRIGAAFVQFTDEELETICEGVPLLRRATQPDGVYPGVPAIDTVGSCTVLMASEDTPTEAIYEFVKILTEHHDELQEVTNAAAIADPENTIAYWAETIPLHSGAEQYFKELGLL